MKSRNSRAAFALSELLCVLAAFAMLAALLFPAFSRARQDAARANCQSNLRQIGRAWLQYAHDYDNQMMRSSTGGLCFSCVAPNAPVTVSVTPIRHWWGVQESENYDAAQSLLQPYLAGDQSYSCPAFAKTADGTEQGLATYGYNAGTLSPTRWGPAPDFVPTPIPAKLSDIEAPARTVAFADAAQLNAKGALRPSTYLSKPASEFPNFHARHAGAGNLLFCDGHVEAMAPVYRPANFATYAGTTAAALRQKHLGDIDEDGDLSTNELFGGKKK